MRFGSVCSGIEAASVAWQRLGWKASWLAEIEPFPSAVLAHHYPQVPNLGDMTKISRQVLVGDVSAPEILVGGTPCQAFSVAGLREGLADDRGQLTIKYVELADAIDFIRGCRGEQPSIIVWENVPGVLSSKDNAFGCFLGALAGEDCELQPSGKKWPNAGCVFGPKRTIAWRVLDAQYFGVAQRRRRVFVVASARKGLDPTAVLFEQDGLRRDTAPSREARQETAGTLASRTGAGGFPGTDEACSGYLQPVVGTLQVNGKAAGSAMQQDAESDLLIPVVSVHGTQDPDVRVEQAHTLGRNSGQENVVLTQYGYEQAGMLTARHDSSPCADRRANIVAYAVSLRGREGGATAELGDDLAGCLRASSGGGDKPYVFSSFPVRDVAQTITSNYGKQPDNSDTALGPNVAIQGMAVRRLTPTECERLQGFPDGYTQVPHRGKPAADGPRYKALGNSMAVPCMTWIGSRIQQALSCNEEEAA